MGNQELEEGRQAERSADRIALSRRLSPNWSTTGNVLPDAIQLEDCESTGGAMSAAERAVAEIADQRCGSPPDRRDSPDIGHMSMDERSRAVEASEDLLAFLRDPLRKRLPLELSNPLRPKAPPQRGAL